MIKTYTCIICPLGCDIETEFDPSTKEIFSLSGASCNKGKSYIEQELTDPQRTIQSSVKIINGDLPLASVTVSGPIPKNRIFDVMDEIRSIKMEAPVCIGQVAHKNVCNLNVDIVITKPVAYKNEGDF